LGTIISTGFSVGTASGINGTFWPMNPWQIGARCRDLMNAGYTQYRARKVLLRYRPNMTGVLAGGTGSVSGNNAPQGDLSNSVKVLAAVGFNRDPTLGALSYQEVVEAGGRIVRMDRPWTFPIKARFPWLFVAYGDTSIGVSTAETRQEYFGQLNLVWSQTPIGMPSGTFSVAIGDIEADWEIDMRFPIDSSANYSAVERRRRALDAIALEQRTRVMGKAPKPVPDDEKKDDSPVLVSEPVESKKMSLRIQIPPPKSPVMGKKKRLPDASLFSSRSADI
jgi:hypothetical protein